MDNGAKKELVAYCGLYCGACGRYRKGKCPGCRKNEKAAWCSVRQCGIANGHESCADCRRFPDQMECAKFNNFFSKIFRLLFGSDRMACLGRIKEIGCAGYAEEMESKGARTVKRK